MERLHAFREQGHPFISIREIPANDSPDLCSNITQQDTVVVAGGDGTLSHLLGTLREIGCRIGLFPLGTGNDLARELGLFTLVKDSSLDALCSFYLQGSTKRITVFAVQYGEEFSSSRYFINYLSIGYDAHVVEAFARLRSSSWWSTVQSVWANRIAYTLLCLRSIGYRIVGPMTINHSNDHIEVSGIRSLIFTNLKSIMGIAQSNSFSNPLDQRIELVEIRTLLDYGRMLLKNRTLCALPLMRGSDSIWEIQSSGEKLSLQLDGEPCPEVVSGAFRIRPVGSLEIIVGDESALGTA